MNWAGAIEVNRSALIRIVAALIAMVGLDAVRLPRAVHSSVLSVLRPAESAVRRLIIIAARGIAVKPLVARPMPAGLVLPASGSRRTRASFPLFDPRKRFALQRRRRVGAKFAPRISLLGDDSHLVPMFLRQSQPMVAPAPSERDDTVDTAGLHRRLQAIKLALENLPAQAKRLKRWQARRAKIPSLKFKTPLRPGPPPGLRKKSEEDVDLVLKECHALAKDVLKEDSF